MIAVKRAGTQFNTSSSFAEAHPKASNRSFLYPTMLSAVLTKVMRKAAGLMPAVG